MRKVIIIRAAGVLLLASVVTFAQLLPGDTGVAAAGNPLTAIVQAWAAAVLAVLGDGALLVGAWKLLEAHHRGAGIIVGLFGATFMYYVATHMRAIMQWAGDLG